ncbi:MAG: MBL fold metallo-hydrolase [candidate division WOR-3 bacterium]
MKIVPLGADSLGTRSFALFIETGDLKIIVDPSCALAPRRNNYPPSPLEIKKLNETYRKIREHVKESDIVIITHYHNDHFPFFDTDIFINKRLFIKDYKRDMNHMQIIRAKRFIEDLEKKAIKYFFADSKDFIFGKTKITFSGGLWHGKEKKQGKVIGFFLEEEEKFFYSSDTQGLWDLTLKDFLRGKRFDYFFLDGPSLYQSKKKDIEEFINDLSDFLKENEKSKVIIDHHFIRDSSYKDYIKKFKEIFGERILTCAMFSGEEDSPLESLRREYYEGKNL